MSDPKPSYHLSWALACLVLSVGRPAFADFEDGVAAARSGDYARALSEWRALAEGGHRDAQFNLGLLYENGFGVTRDPAVAASWYRRAAEQGDREAQAYLGDMYGRGFGVKRDDAEALAWYRRAGELGHAASQHNVGLFYALGRGVEPDVVQAYAWLTVAQENGDTQIELREDLRKQMSRQTLDEARRLVAEVRKRCKVD